MEKVAGQLSKYASVVTEPHGEGLRFCVQLSGGDYVEFVLHESECEKLQEILHQSLGWATGGKSG